MSVSIELIKVVATALDELNDQSVFVGGATIPLYLPEALKPTARPTEDIDVVVELIPKQKLHDFEDLLRKKGFQHDTLENAPICRWKLGTISVDIMTPDEDLMGFTNRWYELGMKNTVCVDISGVEVQIMTRPFFLATKLEAFKGRGKGDYLGSTDMEDIITIVDGTNDEVLLREMSEAPKEVNLYLKDELSKLMKNQDFFVAVTGAVPDRVNPEARADEVIERIRKMVS